MNLKNWIILPLLCIGFVLIAWAFPSYAAQLKDIRVGDYETHTRIVFEHGDIIPSETIRPLASGQLSVVFSDTDLDLIRKIPTDRSKRLKEIKIWQHQNELSLVLTFAFEQFRYELSRIDQPKRLVLDVYRLAPAETTLIPEPGKKEAVAANGKKDAAPDAQPPADKFQTEPKDNLQTHSSGDAKPSSDMDRNTGFSEHAAVQQKERDIADQPTSPPTPPVSAETTEPEQPPAPKLDPSRQTRTIEPPPEPAARTGRLQHLLVIGLVVLTLVILVLLLVMLVSKNRWANSSSPIKPGDFLERQDERIATLDAKIQEQLKRFDKA